MVYKLTDENGQTYNGTQWGPGVSHSGTGEGQLCGPGYIHYYSDPLLAVFLNPIHANFEKPRLWEASASGKTLDDRGLKAGSVKLTTIREIPLPAVTTDQRIAFGILCALEVCKDRAWRKWARGWLSGKDRSKEAARAAAAAAAAREAAEARAAWWAAAAAEAAREAAEAAAEARAAREAAAAAAAATTVDAKPLDLIKIARKALAVK